MEAPNDAEAHADPVLQDIRCLVEHFVLLLVREDKVLELPLTQDQNSDDSEGAGAAVRMISLTAQNGRYALQYSRILEVLSRLHALLLADTRVTQRDLFYQVKGKLIGNPATLAAALRACSSILRVPRGRLHVRPMSRGVMGGALSLRDDSSGAAAAWIDLSAAPLEPPPAEASDAGPGASVASFRAPVWNIPGDLPQIQGLKLRGNPHYILVIEKDALFQRLLDDRLATQLPCVLVTARGFPDLATRALLHRLTTAFPGAPVVGLVDWNPSGIAILRQYRQGGRRGNVTGAEGKQFAIPGLSWLGVRSSHLGITAAGEVANEAVRQGLQDLSARDKAMLRGLEKDADIAALAGWMGELRLMGSLGKKAEAELAYESAGGAGRFTALIAGALLRQDFV